MGRGAGGRLQSWLAAHATAVVVAIVLASSLLRAGHFVALNHGAVFAEHLAADTDMNFFHEWAKRIAAGDLLQREPLHPFHFWHQPVAEIYLRAHPEAAQALVAQGAGDAQSQARRLWDRWYGGPVYHQEPLYAYAVGATYAAFGPDPRWVFAWQMVLGVLANVLVYLIARRHFGELVGAVAALVAVLCGAALMYDTTLLRTTPTAFCGLALVYLLDRVLLSDGWRAAATAGAAGGLAVLLQSSFALFVLGAAAWLLLRGSADRALRVRQCAAFAAGVALGLAPLVARNVAVGVPALSSSSVAAVTFLNSNYAGYEADSGFNLHARYCAEIMGRAGGRLLPVVVETLRTHDGPGSYLAQLAWKVKTLWHWYEIPNNVSFDLHRQHSWALRAAWVPFALIGPLALVGLALAARRWREHVALLLLVAAGIVPMLMFYVLARFRAPLALALAPFAALTIVQLAAWVREGEVRRVAATACVLATLLAWTCWPLRPERTLIPSTYYKAHWTLHHGPRYEQARSLGAARSALDEALRTAPAFLQQLAPGRPVRNLEERVLAAHFGSVHRLYAETLLSVGERAAAAGHLERADKLWEAAR